MTDVSYAKGFRYVEGSKAIKFGSPFDDPDADLVLRSSNRVDFRVNKATILKASPVLREIVRSQALASQSTDNAEKRACVSLPVVQLPERHDTLYPLLTAIFPVTVSIPNNQENLTLVLAAAQKYRMDTAMTLLRTFVEKERPNLVHRDNAFSAYGLAWQNRLLPETLAAARLTLESHLSIQGLGESLKYTHGTSLYQLQLYRENSHLHLSRALTQFRLGEQTETRRMWGPQNRMACERMLASGVPVWLDGFLRFMQTSRPILDFTKFHRFLMDHVASTRCDFCRSKPPQLIDAFWEALTKVVEGALSLADSEFVFEDDVHDALEVSPHSSSTPVAAMPFGAPFDRPDADLVLRSSNLVDFRVHKLLLSLASPFFRTMFSLPQTAPNSQEKQADIPVICVSEDSNSLNGLLSLIYPLPLSVPDSYEAVLKLLAAAEKYEMESAIINIRSQVLAGDFPNIDPKQPFHAYALASRLHLELEARRAAFLTLNQPMTFSDLGATLRCFDGAALYELARYRAECRNAVLTCLEKAVVPFSEAVVRVCEVVGVLEEGCYIADEVYRRYEPVWWRDLVRSRADDLRSGRASAVVDPAKAQAAFLATLEPHIIDGGCAFCFKVFFRRAEYFSSILEDMISEAIEKIDLDLAW
ncbi:hypothetical protein BC834DRAFT_276533 [Gloeopeniophorella convolvens]|nr:hypothetical protein BC834DRAFT_276533 [Gloeopeniophorella convolvens]